MTQAVSRRAVALENQYSIPGQFKWDLSLAKGPWDRFFFQYFAVSIILSVIVSGQAKEAWEPKHKGNMFISYDRYNI